MGLFQAMLRFLVLAAVFGYASATSFCINCATTGLKANWALTGYPVQPATMKYDDRCAGDTADAIDSVSSNCATSTCVEMSIPTGNNQYEILRGCHGDLTGTNGNFSQTISGIAANTFKCSVLKFDTNRVNVLNYCVADEEATKGCNSYMHTLTTGLKYPSSTANSGTCTSVTGIDCIVCATYDGKGKCSGSKDQGKSTGFACAKTTGKLNGHDYIDRAPTTILPTDKTDFCMTINGNQTTSFGPTIGANVTRTKRAINQVFTGHVCYCSQGGCNSAPTLIGSSLTLMLLLLSALPFFC